MLVLTSCPDAATAERIGRALVEARLAACVNQWGPVTSIYRWKGAIEQASEVALLIKTTGALCQAVQNEICRLHPYELPEAIVLSLDGGLPPYLEWIVSETRADTEADA